MIIEDYLKKGVDDDDGDGDDEPSEKSHQANQTADLRHLNMQRDMRGRKNDLKEISDKKDVF